MLHRAFLASVALALLVGACGSKDHAGARGVVAGPPADDLVTMSRVRGVDPEVDDVAVGLDGRVQVRRLRGGAGGHFDHFRLRAGELSRLRTRVARLQRGRDTEPAKQVERWYYTLRVGAHVPRYFVDGRWPARARPALVQLNALIATSPQRDPSSRSRYR